MLRAEYALKPLVSENDAKQHLHQIRHQRQSRLAATIKECHRIRLLHKRMFDDRSNTCLAEKPLVAKPAPLQPIYSTDRQTDVESDDLPITKETSEYLSDSSYLYLDCALPNNKCFSTSTRKGSQRYFSVSPVPSAEKHTNRVYESWPDHAQISQIVGYRVEKLPPILTQNRTNNKKKQNKQNKFVDAIKQIKSRSSIQRNSLIKLFNEISSNEPAVIKTTIHEIKPKLPSFICPSSIYYSKRIQTRQWLCDNYFPTQTVQHY